MARRIRTLKPEWLENERLGSCSDSARILSVALILLADDHGRGRGSDRYLEGQTWAYLKTSIDVAAVLSELVAIDYVRVYAVDGQRYYELPGWNAHQRIDRPSQPRIPINPTREGSRGLASDSRGLDADRDRDRDRDLDQDQDLLPRDPKTPTATVGKEAADKPRPVKASRAGSKKRKLPIKANPPLPFTVEQLISAFKRGARDAFAETTWDKRLAAPLTALIRQLEAQKLNLRDVEGAGEIVAEWHLDQPVAMGWLATTGKLLDAISKDKAKNGRSREPDIMSQFRDPERPAGF